MTVDGSLTLYAQWAAWTPTDRFQYHVEDGGAVITACTETGPLLVVPERIDGYPVTVLASGAFRACPAETVVLPKSLVCIEENAFSGAALSELCFFDNLERFSDASFTDCEKLSTLRISAIEDHYGYSFRRESVLADKYDLLILTGGRSRLVFYGGCSMWYNLIGEEVKAAFDDRYTIVNAAVNGLSNSLLQMEILHSLMTENDMLIHAPELSSSAQLLTDISMNDDSDKLWCALEYNYDLLSLVDIRLLDGCVFDSLRAYFDRKKPGGSYADVYRDSRGNAYMDDTGCIPFVRTHGLGSLSDIVRLDPDMLSDLSRLEREYVRFSEKGIPVYMTHTCIDLDRVPAEERDNADRMGELFTERFSAMEGVAVFGDIRGFSLSRSGFLRYGLSSADGTGRTLHGDLGARAFGAASP